MLKNFLEEIKATYWYKMFVYGNIMLNTMTLTFLGWVVRKEETSFQVNGQVNKPNCRIK
jgi:hypothetical protein